MHRAFQNGEVSVRIASIDVLAVLHIHVLVQIHAADKLLGGLTGREGLVVVREIDVVADAVHDSFKVLPLAVVQPLPLIFVGGLVAVIAEVAVQDVRAGIEGLIAVIQIGGNGIVGADPRGGFAVVLDGDNFVNVVLRRGLAVGVLFALRGADDRHQDLVACVGNEAGVVRVALLFNELDLHAAGAEGVVGLIVIGEVSERGAHNGDRQKGDAEAQRGNLLLHVLGTPSLSN